jgi:hypothetical protein
MRPITAQRPLAEQIGLHPLPIRVGKFWSADVESDMDDRESNAEAAVPMSLAAEISVAPETGFYLFKF